MKFLSHIRSRSKLKQQENAHAAQFDYAQFTGSAPHDQPSNPSPASNLAQHVLRKIFTYVCPHTEDETYVSSDDSMVDGGCMLCDMRDLAQCALVRKTWSEVASLLL